LEAEPYLREALETSLRVLSDENPDTLRAQGNLGDLLLCQARFVEAEPHVRKAWEGRRRVLGDEHPDTLAAISNMGRLLQAQGRSTEALGLLAPAEDAAREMFTGGHAPRLGRFLTALGRARCALAEFDAAEANLSEAHLILSEARGATDRDRMDVLSGLVQLYDAWHAAEPREGYDLKLAEWRAKLP
jgi:tetratricopeptide (TPR) repeat protein